MSYNPNASNAPGSSGQKSGHSPGLTKIREAKRRRDETDQILSPLWVLAPILAGVVSAAIMFLTVGFGTVGVGMGGPEFGATFCLGYIASIIVGMVIVAYPWYMMIKRRTEHFKRDHTLTAGIVEYLNEEQNKGKANLSQELATLQSLQSEMTSEEDEKSPILYTIIIFVIPYIGLWYVLYFLMKDIYSHHQKIVAFEENSRSAVNKLGHSVVVPSWKDLPQRNFVLYLILSCCIPFFGLYWMYTIIKDYNDHFKSQWHFEDQIAGGDYEKGQSGGPQGPSGQQPPGQQRAPGQQQSPGQQPPQQQSGQQRPPGQQQQQSPQQQPPGQQPPG
ncbi:MAG: hypothetical protein KGY76_06730, partial [Candidatus Thermoplasmatota archaeon]|nr:hypothetical protein [Candidatus Thermoplasmatota archaeon]